VVSLASVNIKIDAGRGVNAGSINQGSARHVDVQEVEVAREDRNEISLT